MGVLPLISDEFGMSDSQAGIIGGAFIGNLYIHFRIEIKSRFCIKINKDKINIKMNNSRIFTCFSIYGTTRKTCTFWNSFNGWNACLGWFYWYSIEFIDSFVYC